MNTSEAIQQIERWLLVPVDYDAVIPALAVIRNTDDFDRYASKVADAEYKTKSSVIENVDAYIEKTSKEPTQEEILAQKLKQISGNAAAKEDLNSRYNNFVQDYVSATPANSTPSQSRTLHDTTAHDDTDAHLNHASGKDITIQCSHCLCDMTICEKEELTSSAIFIYIITFILFGPFVIIPIIMKVGMEKKKYYRCPNCKKIHKI